MPYTSFNTIVKSRGNKRRPLIFAIVMMYFKPAIVINSVLYMFSSSIQFYDVVSILDPVSTHQELAAGSSAFPHPSLNRSCSRFRSCERSSERSRSRILRHSVPSKHQTVNHHQWPALNRYKVVLVLKRESFLWKKTLRNQDRVN